MFKPKLTIYNNGAFNMSKVAVATPKKKAPVKTVATKKKTAVAAPKKKAPVKVNAIESAAAAIPAPTYVYLSEGPGRGMRISAKKIRTAALIAATGTVATITINSQKTVHYSVQWDIEGKNRKTNESKAAGIVEAILLKYHRGVAIDKIGYAVTLPSATEGVTITVTRQLTL